jgi:hypothetical protein
MLSGIGLMLYSRTVSPFSGKVATNFIPAGIFMCIYAVCTGVVLADLKSSLSLSVLRTFSFYPQPLS